VLRVELMNINNYGNGRVAQPAASKVGETKYTLMQSLPLWGKREPRGRVRAPTRACRRAAAEAARADLGGAHQGGLRRVLPRRRQRAALHRSARTDGAGSEQVAQARYTADSPGTARRDPRAQTGADGDAPELIALDGEKRQIRARLECALPPATARALADPLGTAPGAAVTLTADASSLAERARVPAIRRSRPSWPASPQHRRPVTSRSATATPICTVGVSPSQMGSRITTWGVMFEMNIPLQQESRRGSGARGRGDGRRRAVAQPRRSQQQLLGDLGRELWPGLRGRAAHRDAVEDRSCCRSRNSALQSGAGRPTRTARPSSAMLLEAQRQIRKARLGQS
jgi:hypothetical protein